MSRFRAAASEDRRSLFVDAISAHRARNSPFCTFEGDPGDGDGQPPWIQFGEDTLNMDCTDAELDRLKSLLDEFPSFTIANLDSPENAEGTNVRVSAFTDEERIAEFVERCFREVYDRPEGYEAWVTEI